jgi:hypothetical protein
VASEARWLRSPCAAWVQALLAELPPGGAA